MKRSRLKNGWRGLIAMFFIAMQGSFASLSMAPVTAWAADSSGSFTISIRLRDIWPPEPIVDLNAVPGAEGQLLLEWTAPSEDTQIAVPSLDPVAAYDLRYATYSVDSLGGDTTAWFNGAIEAFGEPSTPAARGEWQGFTVDLEPGVTYYFAIKSIDDGGNISPIDVKAATPGQQARILLQDNPPPSPANLAALAGPEGIALTWEAVTAPDLNFYRLYVDSTAPYDFSDAYTLKIDSAASSFLHTNLAFGATNTYKLSAVDRGAPEFLGQALESGFSNISTATFQQKNVRPYIVKIVAPASLVTPDGTFYGVVITSPSFRIEFSERVRESSLLSSVEMKAIRDNTGKVLSSSVPIEITLATTGVDAAVIPSTALVKGYTYELRVSTGLMDLAGNNFIDEFITRFQTELDKSVENVVSIGKKSFLRLPPDALEGDVAIVANTKVLEDPVTVEVTDILTASSKLVDNTDGALKPIEPTTIELYLVDSKGVVDDIPFYPSRLKKPAQEVGDLKPVIMVAGYDDEDQDGFVDGLFPKVKEKDLAVFALNPEDRRWIRILDTKVDPVENQVIAPIKGLGVYTMVSTLDTFLGNAHAYPVPFREALGHTHITFTDLSSRANIRIYTVTGKLVKTLYESDGDGELKWDARNEEGESVASGVYLFIMESATEKKLGKLIIIR
ncbi:MAG: Ig-like domain-containing protein [Elusimicrobia bacterium]|nr:Ig-like domain-containing protein [Elusimicrobiota bacterium]